MDESRFDSLARTLFQTPTRRGALGILMAGAVAMVDLAADSDAKQKKKKKKKKPPKQSGSNAGGSSSPDPTPPGPNQACASRCGTGCCTSELGDCILPAQQGGARCGTGGELCHQCDSGVCKPLGNACAPTEACCPDGPRRVECQEGLCRRPRTQRCTTSGECCADAVCAPESDFDPELRCLGSNGASCNFISDCADFLVCRTGRCCASTYWPCELDEHCCAAEELCRVVPGAGPEKQCCLSTGTFCNSPGVNVACCSGTCNANQTCS